MKKKLSLLLTAVLVLIISSAFFAACSDEPTLRSFAVKEGTLQTEYAVGETLNLSGAKITLTMSDDSVKEESITADMVSGFTSVNSGTRPMLITYQGLMIAVNYTVTAPVVPTADSIALKPESFRSSYLLGSELSFDNAKLIVNLSDGTMGEVPVTADMVTGFDSSKTGAGVLYISYQGKLCVFHYTVIAEIATLKIPVLALNGNVLSWEKQALANGYEVYLKNKLVATVTDNFYNIPSAGVGYYEYSVKAKGNGESVMDSAVSESITYIVSLQSVSRIELDQDGFSWQECIGATGYTVKADGKEYSVTEPRYNMEFKEDVTYVVNVKVHYGAKESEYSQNFAFCALKTPSNLKIKENETDRSFSFSWEREDCRIDTGYTLYYKSGEKIVPFASNIEGKAYTVSFATFKDRQIDNIFVAAADSRADCIALGKSNAVQLPSQITTLQRPSGFYIDGSIVVWDSVSGASSYSLSGVENDGASTSSFDTSKLSDGQSYTLIVTAKPYSAYDYDSQASAYSFYKHAAPTALAMRGSVLSFTGNAKALLYQVSFLDKTYVTSGLSLDLSEQVKELAVGTYTVYVRALPSGFMSNEVPSSAQSVTFEVRAMTFSLSGTTLSWESVENAVGYRVRVNGGKWTDNGSGTNVTVSAGTSTVEVVPYNNDGDVLVGENIAKLITLTYDVNGGTPAIAPVTRLVGGTVGTLPEVNNHGSTADWYDSADILTRKPVSADTVITQDTTIYADYDLIRYDTSGASATVTGLYYTPDKDFSIAIPKMKNGKTVTAIAENAFKDCSGLKSITIPDSVTSIGNSAFYGCSGLTSITIPDGVTSIGDSAFFGCSSLISVTIPDSVMSIGNSAFSGCSGLTNITLPFVGARLNGTSNTYFSYIFGTSNNGIPVSLKSVTITGGESISSYAFSGCSGLTSIAIPDSVTIIGSYAFSGCSGLKSMTIPEGLTSIGSYAFEGCDGLTSIIIPDSVTSIGNGSFNSCDGLTSILIGSGVASIGELAFYGCGGIESITVATGNTTYHSEGNCIIEIVTKTLILGCKTGIIPSDGSVTSIGSYAFMDCSSLKSIIIPDSVTSIGSYAFSGCSGLTNITIGSGVASIGRGAFFECSGLKSIIIPDSVTSIGDAAFKNCGNLTNVTMGNSVTSIGNQVFMECYELSSIIIPNSVASIGDYAFYGCSGLTNVSIPNSVTTIGDKALTASSITSITYSGTKAEWSAISKGNNWNEHTLDYTITCTDGTLSKSESMSA